jgi:Ca2+-binding EF-hand superfamily protein
VKLFRMLIATLMVLGATPALAQADDDWEARKARLLEKYDSDGDGQLSREELSQAREEMQRSRIRRDPWAEDGKGPDRRRGQPGPGARQGRQPRLDRRAILERFDEDGDGQLDEQERRQARRAMQRRQAQRRPGQGQAPGARGQRGQRPTREELFRRFDTDGDGQLDEQERQRLRQEVQRHRARRGGQGRMGDRGQTGQRPSREEILQRFDANGNGQLDPEERRQVRQAMQRRRQGGPGQPGARQRARPGREEILKRFDANGNGQLDPEEREAARQAMQERRRGAQGPGRRTGEQGPGRRGGPGPGARGPSRDEILKQYDANGDGKLDEAEREKLREEMRARRPAGPAPEGPPPAEPPPAEPEEPTEQPG